MKNNSMMLRNLLLVNCFIFFTSILQVQSQNIMLVHNAVGLPDSIVAINVELQTVETFVAFVFEIPLPEGFTYVENSVIVDPPELEVHTNVLTDPPTLRISCFNLTGTFAYFALVTFLLETPSQTGTYQLNLQNAIIGNIQGENIITDIVNGIVSIIEIPAFLPGDANCDGVVNVQDIVSIISYILGNSPQPFCFENADVNQDGLINVSDVVGTVNIILNL